MQTEDWFIFDLDSHIDPNFLEWLGSQGIAVKFRADGSRGAIAQKNDLYDLSPSLSDPSYYSVDDLPRINLSCGRVLPEDLSDYFDQGKKTRAYLRRNIHSGDDNYGRDRPEPPKCNHPDCLAQWGDRCKKWDEREQGKYLK